MFATIRHWLGKPPDQKFAERAALQALDAVAPLKFAPENAPPAAANEEHAYICRETVINRHERIDGFEFSLSPRLQSRFTAQSALAKRVHDDAILRNLSHARVASLLGERYAFVRLSPEALNNPALETFFNTRLAVLLNPQDLPRANLPALREKLLWLRDNGISHGWTLAESTPDLAGELADADFVEVEVPSADAARVKMMYRELRLLKGHPKLIASRLQCAEDFNLCFQCGFDYFSGPFAVNRDNWRPAKSEIDRTLVIEVLNSVRSGAEFHVIANRLRTEPVVTFKLLRYINSPSIGLTQKITDVSQALVVLGTEKFHRWLSLLLFDFKKSSFHESVLKEQVLARARFMEMIAGRGRVPGDTDLLFITGLFSLMDVMMGQPIAAVLKQVSLPAPVADALQGKPGPMRDALMLSIAVETGTPQVMSTAAGRCGLDAQTVTVAAVEALAWAQQASVLGE